MKLIVAYQRKDNGIGIDNKIPWHLAEDLIHFKRKTSKIYETCVNNKSPSRNIVVMGRKTWDSIPSQFKPLKNRVNYVVSRDTTPEFKQQLEKNKETYLINDLDKFLSSIEDKSGSNMSNVWIIGGETIYKQSLPYATEIHVTEIYTEKSQEYECTVFFPEIDMTKFKITDVTPIKKAEQSRQSDKALYYRFVTYKRGGVDFGETNPIWRSSEHQYLDTLTEILNHGQETTDRTGVGTLSVFGKQFKYDLADGFPALTTKRIFLRGVFEELMMYLRGETDNTILQEKNIHIWDGNTSREFLDKRGLQHYPEGDMGETYGYNYRNFGGEYDDCKVGISKKDGFDQLAYVIDLIKNDPHSRRIIINLWNPNTLHKAALPSCLCQYQFYVDTKRNTLNLQIYIRSSDFFLANNWNTCTGTFVTYMLCNLEGIALTPGILTVVTGDTHLYNTHLDGVRENINRKPRPYPILEIKEKKTQIEDFTWEDMNIIGYFPMKNIKADMAV